MSLCPFRQQSAPDPRFNIPVNLNGFECYERTDIDGNKSLVSYCSLRGRVNDAQTCRDYETCSRYQFENRKEVQNA